MANPLLAVEDLTVERGGRTVLSRLAFVLASGETILVSGRNGAGKSTLLRTLAGLLQPAAGRVRYGLADEERRGVETIHYLGYEDALKPSLTVRENLEFWAAMLRAPFAAGSKSPEEGRPAPLQRTEQPMSHVSALSAQDALATFGVARLLDLPAAYLSAGQRRRVALARLLTTPRPIWLLDEPLIALDASAQELTVAVMSQHTRSGGAILVASHQQLATTTGRIELDAIDQVA